MKYKLTPSFNDSMNNAPPVEADVSDSEEWDDSFLRSIMDELVNDEGIPFGPGFTLTIERIE